MDGYEDRPPAGIGGWLAFFLVIIGILSPLRILFETVTLLNDPVVGEVFGEAWAIIAPLEWTFSATQIGLAWFMAWRLLKVRTWQTVRIVIAGIWIVALAVPLFEVIAVSQIGGFPLGQLLADSAIELIRGLVFCVIWSAYFLLSKRVANTYLRPGADDDTAEVFS